jgi:hypothetical protein
VSVRAGGRALTGAVFAPVPRADAAAAARGAPEQVKWAEVESERPVPAAPVTTDS